MNLCMAPRRPKKTQKWYCRFYVHAFLEERVIDDRIFKNGIILVALIFHVLDNKWGQTLLYTFIGHLSSSSWDFVSLCPCSGCIGIFVFPLLICKRLLSMEDINPLCVITSGFFRDWKLLWKLWCWMFSVHLLRPLYI